MIWRHCTEKVAVMGSGSWGTALAVLLAENGHDVALWSYRQEEAEAMAARARTGSFSLELRFKIHSDYVGLREGFDGKAGGCAGNPILIPAQYTPTVQGPPRKRALLINVAKGLEESTLQTLGQVIAQECPEHQVAALSGPSHAEEVSRKIPTTVVASSASEGGCGTDPGAVHERVFSRVYKSRSVGG
ncbi:MAG: 2-dehydropantoate 2-reductase N-terminal domain-containing protein [Clostridia bacterium]